MASESLVDLTILDELSPAASRRRSGWSRNLKACGHLLRLREAARALTPVRDDLAQTIV
jgi:hypothetical protein